MTINNRLQSGLIFVHGTFRDASKEIKINRWRLIRRNLRKNDREKFGMFS